MESERRQRASGQGIRKKDWMRREFCSVCVEKVSNLLSLRPLPICSNISPTLCQYILLDPAFTEINQPTIMREEETPCLPVSEGKCQEMQMDTRYKNIIDLIAKF